MLRFLKSESACRLLFVRVKYEDGGHRQISARSNTDNTDRMNYIGY